MDYILFLILRTNNSKSSTSDYIRVVLNIRIEPVGITLVHFLFKIIDMRRDNPEVYT